MSGCAGLSDDCPLTFVVEKSLVLARLNRYRPTKVDAAELAGLIDTAAFSIFPSVSARLL